MIDFTPASYPIVAKAGGLQSQGAKGAAVVDLLQALGNVGSEVLRLSRRVKKMAYNGPFPQVHLWSIPRKAHQYSVLPSFLCNIGVHPIVAKAGGL
jgi:hypothetical protein